MTDIKITSYEPGNGRADLDITVDGVGYSAVWYDDEDPQIMGDRVLSDAVYTEVKERIELFFTFFDHARLQTEITALTEEALGAMEQHLEQNAVLTEDTVVTVTRHFNVRIHQSYDLTLKAGERVPDDLNWEFDERVCGQGTFLHEETELLDNDELETEIAATRPASAPAWTP